MRSLSPEALHHVNTMLIVWLSLRRTKGSDAAGQGGGAVEWEDRLDDWELELELAAQLEGSDWVTLERAAAETGASRAALRTWYRSGQIPSRLVAGPHGPQRLVPLAMVASRAEASPRLRRTAERRIADQAELEIMRHRIDQLELRLAALEQRERPGR
jgi:transposase